MSGVAGKRPLWLAGVPGFEPRCVEFEPVSNGRMWAQHPRRPRRLPMRIGPRSIRPQTSNKMIQKELAFRRERSGTVTVPGAKSPFGILPRRPPGHCGASVVAAPIAVATEWRIP
jgi:hypothetical protein